MSKYVPLGNFLRRQKTETVVLTFAEIERILARILPKASVDPAWWRADATSSQPLKQVLAEVGFVAQPIPREERVEFRRLKPTGRPVRSDDVEFTGGSVDRTVR